MKTPILITASIKVNNTPFTILKNIKQMSINYCEGLLCCLKDKEIESIVFAKNCDLKINVRYLEKVASSYGKSFEFIQVTPSHKTSVQGKGFGEDDLIKKAILKSEIIRISEFKIILGIG